MNWNWNVSNTRYTCTHTTTQVLYFSCGKYYNNWKKTCQSISGIMVVSHFVPFSIHVRTTTRPQALSNFELIPSCYHIQWELCSEQCSFFSLIKTKMFPSSITTCVSRMSLSSWTDSWPKKRSYRDIQFFSDFQILVKLVLPKIHHFEMSLETPMIHTTMLHHYL